MSTSILDGLVPFDSTLYGTDDDPVDATIWRDGIANGALHAADSHAQVRVNLAFPDASAFSTGGLEYIEGPVSPVADEWFQIGAPFGPWPLTRHADGAPYVLRIRLAISASSGGVAQVVRVVIAPDDSAVAERDRNSDNVYETGTSSATPAWVTGNTTGALGASTYMVVSAADASRWTRSRSVFDAVNGASPSAIDQCLVSAHVFARTANGTVTTRLHNLLIAEYVGT